MELQGKVAIVTGGSAGIGRAYALALAAAGATVVAAARTLGRLDDAQPEPNTLAEVVHSSRELPGRVYAHVCDLNVEADIQRLIDQAVANFGRIDILVNNAGIYPRHSTLAITGAEWDASMQLNMRAPYLTIRYAAPHMIRQGSGSIVNLTAAAATGVFPKGHPGHDGLLAYALSKAALNRLSTFMAEELREHGIAVNAMSPGAVRTDVWKAVDPDDKIAQVSTNVKLATPEVLGPALIYLAQQTASTLTGQILHNDEFGKSWP